jgi:DNA-binding response OmpR family regulator
MKTVLVVDDEFDIRELLVDTLTDAGYNVIEAVNGNAALERIAADHPDIVLLDIWMPGMDGLEVLAQLRLSPDTAALPVILLTAMPADAGESAGLNLGVTHYVNKPWDSGVVEATLRTALREAGATVD